MSRGAKGVELRCGRGAWRGFGPSCGGDELGVDRLESLLLCPESWDMNEKTGGYDRGISTGNRGSNGTVDIQAETGGGEVVVLVVGGERGRGEAKG